ncbi:hypothetical protein AWENTII_012927 [Aspergillus wentii]
MYLFFFLSVAAALQTLPPVKWTPLSGEFSLSSTEKTIYIDKRVASHRDANGLTLIPPSAYEFADTFRHDLEEVTGNKWDLQTVDTNNDIAGIYLGLLDHHFTYDNGRPTEEAYTLNIQPDRISILGSGSRGIWWGTRTLLQQLLINETIPAGQVADSPAYPTRGFLLDAGRKWYAPSYLKDLCTYASFFKMSEFHYHLSDNYPLSRGPETPWNEVYSQFSLHPENPELVGLVQRENETLSRTEFDDVQRHCASRGVTVIPEIDAPGHCLTLTKMKPEIALDTKDLLNLSHPETIPLLKSIWTEFLPWFHTKEVHIGADEYDSSLADDYISFVNEMADFINATSGKKTRIWGTPEPSETLNISTDVIIQHWQYGQSDPVELVNQGYEIINSEDWWAYISLKNDHMPLLPAPYPQLFNNTRLLNFADQDGLQWDPSWFNPVNISEQPDRKHVGGAILAAWNDNGPDATTQLEYFYAIRNGIPVVASKAWTGGGLSLDEPSLSDSIDLFTSKAVGQNLDRRLDSSSWSFDDKSEVILGKGSKGMNYTLELDANGPFILSSSDATLSLVDDGTLSFTSDGWEYPLRSIDEADGFDPSYPGRIWTNQTTSTHEVVHVPLQSNITISTDVIGGSRVWVDGEFVGRFEVFVYGGKNQLFSWSQMAFVAPMERAKRLRGLKLYS